MTLEEKIKARGYRTIGHARAAIGRTSGLSKNERQRLHGLTAKMYADAPDISAPRRFGNNGTGPTHIGLTELPELDALAFKVALFAAKNNITVADLVTRLVERIDKL